MTARILEYRLPTSPRYPRLRGTDVRDQWHRISRFLARWTDAPASPDAATLELSAARTTERTTDLAIAAAVRQFGVAQLEEVGDRAVWQWELHGSAVETAISYLAAGEPWTGRHPEYASLSWLISFQWRDPDTGAPWPGQVRHLLSVDALEGQSTLMFSVGRDGFAWGHLHLPFGVPDDACVQFLRRMLPDLPFAFSTRHLSAAVESSSDRRLWDRRKLSRETVAGLRNALGAT